MKHFCILAAVMGALTCLDTVGFAENTNSTPTVSSGATTNKDAGATPADAPKPVKKSQSDVASKSAVFGKIAKTDDAYKNALDAHDLAGGIKQTDKDGALKGTVAKVFEPRGGAMAILNFDDNYQSAMTALLKKDNFEKFPDLKSLVGKEVIVTGKFVEFQGHAEIILTAPEQVKLAE